MALAPRVPTTREPPAWVANELRSIAPTLVAYWYPELKAWQVLHYAPSRSVVLSGRQRLRNYPALEAGGDGKIPVGKKRLAWLMADGWSLLFSSPAPQLTGADLIEVSRCWNATTADVLRAQREMTAAADGTQRRKAQEARRVDFAQDHGRYLAAKVGRQQVMGKPIIIRP